MPSEKYTSMLLPGSGTFGVESTLRTAVSTAEKILIAANGAYGERMIKICEILNIPHKILRYDEKDPVKTQEVLEKLTDDITHFSMVHSETTTGLLNDIGEVTRAVKKKNPSVVVIGDCVSSFGAVDADFSSLDFIVTCSNKLLQGVPGLALVIANKHIIEKCEGKSRSRVLDLYKVFKSQTGFISMPPFQSVYGLKQAIDEFWEEGGVQARQARYQNNKEILKREMEKLGFQIYIKDPYQGWIISTFTEPKHPNYNFKTLYQCLVDKNIIIYPGKLTKLQTFRIGTIGDLHEKDMLKCVDAIKDAFESMNIKLPIVE